MRVLFCLTMLLAVWGCGSSEEPSDATNGPKLTQTQAQQYKGLIPGSRKSQNEH